MALLNTITTEVRGSLETLFTALSDTVITGMVISNRLAPNAFLTLKRGDETLLINERIEQGRSFSLALKIGLEANQTLVAYASASPVTLIWNGGSVEDWNSEVTEDWNSADTGSSSVLIAFSYAEI